MRIGVTSVLVDDQQKALEFYTNKLGFQKKHDIPAGGARWLTVVSPEDPEGVEVLLEPTGYDFSQVYQKALYDHGIPLTMFMVDDARKEYERLSNLGVMFHGKPTESPDGISVILDDTCGNLIMLHQLFR